MTARRRIVGRIYFIEAVGLDLVKIGWTAGELGTRLRALQCASPVELRLYGAMHGSLRQERHFHRLYAADHIRGEWFRFTPSLREFVSKNAQCGLLMGSGSDETGQKPTETTPARGGKEQ